MTTPKAAAPELPSNEGSASGLRVSAWKATPATASAPPASAATAILGRRIDSVTTRSTDSAAACPVSALRTARGEIAALPRKSAPAATTTRAAASAPSTSSRRRAGLICSGDREAGMDRGWPATGACRSLERLRVDRPRELLEAVHEAWAVAVEEVAVHAVQPAGPDRRELREAPPLLLLDRARARAVVREQDHVRRPGDRGLQAVARIRVALRGRDGLAAGEPDQLGDERCAPGDDQRLGPEHVEDARARPSEDRPGHRGDPLFEARDQRARGVPARGQLADANDEGRHVAHAVGGDEVRGDPEALELGDGLLAVALGRRDDEVGLEGDDRLEARVDHSTDAGLLAGRRRVVTEVGDARQGALRSQREHDLGDARDERDDAPWRRGDRHLAAEHVARREPRRRRGEQQEPRERGRERGHARDPAHAATK